MMQWRARRGGGCASLWVKVAMRRARMTIPRVPTCVPGVGLLPWGRLDRFFAGAVGGSCATSPDERVDICETDQKRGDIIM